MGKVGDFYKESAVGSPYGDSRDGGSRKHRGVDFSHSTKPGTVAVPAARAGRVVGKRYPSSQHGFGNGIVIRSVLDDGNEWDISYSHGHYQPSQKVGDSIAAGEIILHEGTTGYTSGSCVHIEQQRVNGGGFIDPEPEMLKCGARDRAGSTTPTPPAPTPPAPTVPQGNPFGIAYCAGLQKIANLNGGNTKIDQIWGAQSAKGFAQFLRNSWGYKGNDALGPVMWAAIARWLRARWGYVGNDVPGPVMRAALQRAETANYHAL